MIAALPPFGQGALAGESCADEIEEGEIRVRTHSRRYAGIAYAAMLTYFLDT